MSVDALRLAGVLGLGVILMLARQRVILLRRLSAFPLWAGMFDGIFIVLIAYSVQGLLLVLIEFPRYNKWIDFVQMLGAFTVHLGFAWAAARIVQALIRKRKAHIPDWRLPGLLWFGLYGLFTLLGTIAFLVSEGRAPAELFVWTGATAAVLAFVMQQTLGDLFSGFSLTIERPFNIGDWIRLEDGTEGQVQDINWRATHLRKWDTTSYVIPNGQLAQQSFTNLGAIQQPFAPWYLVKVSGEHHPERVMGLLKKAVAGCNIPLPTPAPVVRLMSADSSPYTYMVWLHFADYPKMFEGREELYLEIDAVFRSEGVAIAADIHEVNYRMARNR